MPYTTLDNEYNAKSTSSASPKRGAGYTVYDPLGQKIGSAQEIFANREGAPEYIRVRMGLFGMKSVLIAVQIVEADEKKTLVLK